MMTLHELVSVDVDKGVGVYQQLAEFGKDD
jgi:hypothetical protein